MGRPTDRSVTLATDAGKEHAHSNPWANVRMRFTSIRTLAVRTRPERKAGMFFTNRVTAGRKLAEALRRFADGDTVVLALPRGGVVVGAEVAKSLDVPLGLILVGKIAHPAYAEYAVGAVAENVKPVYNVAEATTLDEEWIKEAEANVRQVIAHRRKLYYGDDQGPSVTHKTVIIVDDGVATGLTMLAAVQAVHAKHSKYIVIAVPVAPQDSLELLADSVDEVIVLDDPSNFQGSIGAHYFSFPQVDDVTVQELLGKARTYGA